MLGWIYILWLIFCTPLVPIGLICLVTYMIYSIYEIILSFLVFVNMNMGAFEQFIPFVRKYTL